MPQVWTQFRNKLREAQPKPVCYMPGDGTYSIYSNPYAAAYAPRTVPPKPPKPATPSISSSTTRTNSVSTVSVTPQTSAGSAPNPAPKGPPKQIECTVCFETKPRSKFPKGNKITETCQHDMDVCSECLTQSIDIQFNGNIWNRIDCPSCGARLAAEDVNRFGSEDVRERYNEHCLNAFLETEDNYFFCRHPGCTWGAEISEDDTTSWLTCLICKGRTCISCDTVWHTGLSCKEDRQRREKLKLDFEASEQRVKSDAKKCPKCNVPGEKISGCDHMRCPICDHEYCWICFADYDKIRKKSNSAHMESCKYHSSRIR